MALNHSLKSIVSNFNQVLRINNFFETPVIFSSFGILSTREKSTWGRAPRVRYPIWYLQKERADYNENLTYDNQTFIQEKIHEKYGPPANISGLVTYESPLKVEPVQKRELTKISRRTGVIVKKIGEYPLWSKNGEKIRTTLVQVVDNHVVKYIPPEEFDPPRKTHLAENHKTFGCLLIGAESGDPSLYTKEYCGLYKNSGVPPKKVLFRFIITPDAALLPGTPLTALHYRPGEFVDLRGNTVDRGFQGVMKRWGFKGMPATHGVTKSHRRPGCISGGAGKAKVHKGKKMPGHMGNRWRVNKGCEILRINTKYNVIWLRGNSIPGTVGDYCYMFDTLLPSKRLKKKKMNFPPVHFPTYVEEGNEEVPEDLYHADVHNFSDASITYEKEK